MSLAATYHNFHQLGKNKPISHAGPDGHSRSLRPQAAELRKGRALWG